MQGALLDGGGATAGTGDRAAPILSSWPVLVTNTENRFLCLCTFQALCQVPTPSLLGHLSLQDAAQGSPPLGSYLSSPEPVICPLLCTHVPHTASSPGLIRLRVSLLRCLILTPSTLDCRLLPPGPKTYSGLHPDPRKGVLSLGGAHHAWREGEEQK